jgi:dolichol-phosphate mannosyltransferase
VSEFKVDVEGPVLSIVVPTRNEAGNVEPLVTGIAAAVRGIPTELIFVDDSTDETPDVLARLAERPPPGLAVRVIHRPEDARNGLGPAAVEGLRMAEGPAVGVMDGDLQHPPDLLPRMLQEMGAQDLDLVVASRYTRGGSAQGLAGPARRLVSAVSRRLAQVLFREARKTSDPLSGYFICRRSAIEGIEFRPVGFKILLELLVCTPAARVGDVPLTFGKRQAGVSNASIRQGLLFLSHLYSLLTQVRGSARSWKYAVVGTAGLAVFLGLLLGSRMLGLGVYQAWTLAFVVSLFLNWQLNRQFTFADVASPFTVGRARPVYLPVALLGGCANLAVFALLETTAGVPVAAVGGAATAMALNYILHRGLLRRPPRIPRVMANQGPLEARVSAVLGGPVYFIPPEGDQAMLAARFGVADPPAELLSAADRRRPVIIAEAPSTLPQARRDAGMDAWLGVPVLEGRRYVGLLVAHRNGAPYTPDEMDMVLRSLRSEARGEVPDQVGLWLPDGDPG